MLSEKILRSLVREILVESVALDPKLLGTVDGSPSIVFGKNATTYLTSKGMTPPEIQTVSARINNISIENFKKYDQAFKQFAAEQGLKPSLLKAMSIEETTLGLSLKNTSGSTAAGLLQINKPTLDTLNANLPNGVRYEYQTLSSDPVASVKIAAHYIKAYLIGKLGLKDRASILKAYKTGPDSSNYVARVEAFKKFVDITGM
jgi:hypothetical protein